MQVRKLVDVIEHASKCHEIKSCTYPNCHQMKMLFRHAARCTVRAAGGCSQCKKAWLGLSSHSRICEEPHCTVPRCLWVKMPPTFTPNKRKTNLIDISDFLSSQSCKNCVQTPSFFNHVCRPSFCRDLREHAKKTSATIFEPIKELSLRK